MVPVRALRLVLPFALLVGFAAVASAVQVLEDLDQGQGQGSSGGGQGDPNPVNPDKNLKDLRERLERTRDEGGAYVPAPIGGQRGIDEIGDDVATALTENPGLTAAVTAALATLSAFGWRLASRYIDPRIALQSPERSMLYGFIKGNPGVHLKQLSTEFRMKTSTVLWHVRKLEHADLIRSKKANGYRVFYPVSGGLEASKVSEAVTALSNANARSIFAFLAEHPTAPLRELADRTLINPGTVRWHLKKLRKAGLLDEDPQGVRITELGVKAWNQIQGTPTTVQVPIVPVPGEAQKSEEITA